MSSAFLLSLTVRIARSDILLMGSREGKDALPPMLSFGNMRRLEAVIPTWVRGIILGSN